VRSAVSDAHRLACPHTLANRCGRQACQSHQCKTLAPEHGPLGKYSSKLHVYWHEVTF